MADPTEFKREFVLDTSGNHETLLGAVVVDQQGRYGFASRHDDQPHMPANGEAAFSSEQVIDSLHFKEHQFPEHIRTEETGNSKHIASERNQRLNEQAAQLRAAEEAIRQDPNASNEQKVAAKEARKAAEATAINGGELKIDDSEAVVLNRSEAENTIEAVKVNEQAQTEAVTSTPRLEGIEKDQLFSPAEGEQSKLVPPQVKEKFVQNGNTFYFKGSDDRVAFKDSGNKLKTKIDGDQIADSMIAIAKNRGWSEIKVTGTESFKKDIWKKASEQGIAVSGYTPTRVERAELEGKGIEIPKQGQSVSPDKPTMTAEEKRAKDFQELSGAEAVKKHPELAPYVAAVEAIEKKVQTEKLSEANKQAIIDRVRMNAVNSINQGVVPTVAFKGRQAQKTAQAELSR